MAEKVTKMAIRVDLGCGKCRKKIKKVLCKIPQIQNQIYDDKSNTVTITVVCCCPEKVKDKICCKAGDIILGIQIIPPQPPAKVPEKPKEKPPEPEKPKQPEKPKEPEKPKQPEKPKEPEKPKQPEKPKEPEKPKQPEKPKENGQKGKPKPEPEKTKPPAPVPDKPKVTIVEPPKVDPKPPPRAEPAPGFPPPAYPQLIPCCRECYEGRGWGPCNRDHYMPPPCYDPCYGRPVYDSWGGGGGRIYVSRCTDYISEENPTASCIIM